MWKNGSPILIISHMGLVFFGDLFLVLKCLVNICLIFHSEFFIFFFARRPTVFVGFQFFKWDFGPNCYFRERIHWSPRYKWQTFSFIRFVFARNWTENWFLWNFRNEENLMAHWTDRTGVRKIASIESDNYFVNFC